MLQRQGRRLLSRRATRGTRSSGACGRKTKLPGGKILIPGVVSHATNVVEHPDLVADRLVRYANIVGREYVVAGTDCGMGGRIHPSLAWAKFEALVEGAQRASKVLWG